MGDNWNMDNIPAEKFRFAQMEDRIHDAKFETKPIGYFKDAWLRFKKNKASIVAACIILFIVLFAVFGPFFSQYKISDADGVYAKVRPKSELLSKIGIMDGTRAQRLNDKYYMHLMAMAMASEDVDGQGATWQEGLDSEYNAITKMGEVYSEAGKDYRDGNIDSYYSVGFRYKSITMSEYEKIKAWEQESGLQVLYPMIDRENEYCDPFNREDANYWYRHDSGSNAIDENGNRISLKAMQANGLVDNYVRDAEGNVMDYVKKDKSMVMVRVLYYNYFIYEHGHEPLHLFGTDAQGYDIFVRMAHGARLSMILAVCVAAINLCIGAIYGAIEGYYGGTIDLIMERVADILSGIPFIVVATLFQLHLVNTGKVSTLGGLLFAFVLTGWIGTAYRVRTQFYRFKKQEYVLAARTLGARDARLMFKHIFPNSLGTIITSSVLQIPSVILSESVLSYLGIANFNSQNMTSLGTMLANGQGTLATDPHIILLPALVISLLMISFNLFGNGLRDAFNPSLRGADE